jgi:formate dehydrogenase alpha subunit
MSEVTLTIDGQKITARPGTTILEAALAHDIYIPHLCHHPDLEPVGVCRLCLVDVQGRGQTLSCRAPVEEGMVVRSDSPAIDAARRVAIELLILNHHGECLMCAKNNRCELQRAAARVGVDQERLARMRRPAPPGEIDESNPFFTLNHDKCILCGICIRTCDEIVGVGALDFAFRGFRTRVSTFGQRPIVESRCESCGECVVRCPVGALAPKKAQPPTRAVKTTCPYCGTGCGIYLGVRNDRVVSARGDTESPVNSGRLCVKGRFGHDFIHHPDRLTKPLIKKNGTHVEATWDEALDLVASKFSAYRGDQFVAMASARVTNEENYVIQKFARQVMQSNHVDHCARLCHAPSVAGLLQTLGSGAMSNTIGEIRDAACILAIGSNTTAAHPIIGLEVKEAVRRGAVLIVANPKQIDLTRHAAIWLQQKPGTDVALLMGMIRVIVDEDLLDRQFLAERCEDFGAFQKSLAGFELADAERITGVPQDAIVQAARTYATRKPASILFAMGITQHTHGTDNVLAISNLALVTGNVGRPSSGVNPLRGQNNVQGACDMGALPNVYPGYQWVNDPAVQQKFESAWGCQLSGTPGMAMTETFHAMTEGRVKALYLVGENPMLSEADSTHVLEGLRALEFFVAQDIFLTETARLADVVLPAATFAEKDGTFTNTERRVQRIRKAIEPLGEARPDWWIACQIARRTGAAGFEFAGPAEIMTEIAKVTPNYGGVSYERLENGGLHWPCPTPEHPGTPMLHGERFPTASGKARLLPVTFKPSAELPDSEYPLLLTTDRSLFHYHTGTMTLRVDGLKALSGEELLRIHPDDALRLGIGDGQRVEVSSRRGKLAVQAKVTDICPPGVVSLTFHFPDTPTNVLTHAALDPVAKIPETKVCAVRIAALV